MQRPRKTQLLCMVEMLTEIYLSGESTWHRCNETNSAIVKNNSKAIKCGTVFHISDVNIFKSQKWTCWKSISNLKICEHRNIASQQTFQMFTYYFKEEIQFKQAISFSFTMATFSHLCLQTDRIFYTWWYVTER